MTNSARWFLERSIASTPLFPWRYELALPAAQLRYTYIPKNGCSTLKLSLGMHEGWLGLGDDPHAIKSRDRLLGQLRTPLRVPRFVVLRHPGHRIASAFQDRFSKASDQATRSLTRKGILKQGQTLDHVTFQQFVHFVASLRRSEMDPHWRPQVDFMYGGYSDVFTLEEFDKCLTFLATQRIAIQQHRPHATTRYTPLGHYAGDLPVAELRNLRSQGRAPSYGELVDNATEALLERVYAEDFAKFRAAYSAP